VIQDVEHLGLSHLLLCDLKLVFSICSSPEAGKESSDNKQWFANVFSHKLAN